MIKEPGTYLLKKEFFKENHIPEKQWESRKADLLEWIACFYTFELKGSSPIMIIIHEVIGEYQPLPRKVNTKELQLAKEKDYTNFTIASLGPEFKPNSKARVAREAIWSFGAERYGHENVKYITNTFVKPVFDEYGESNGVRRWVWYETYEPLDQETLERWRQIMFEEHISESEAANAFYRQEQGEDISKEKGYFAAARARFKSEFGSCPILVSDWRLKKGAD